VRRLALVLALALAGALACDGRAANDDDKGGGGEGDAGDSTDVPGTPSPPPVGHVACVVDADCAAAASTCCACPTFAVPARSGWPELCEDVPCDAPGSCSAVSPVCRSSACVLACSEIACDRQCADGFVVDGGGCLTCACRTPSSPVCTAAADCARVPADCCGCARGGADTAVAVNDVERHQRELACGPEARCPEVNVCPAGIAPACRGGRCVLDDGDPGTAPAGACGHPDLPPCPAGTRCLLNRSPDADAAGVGVCA